MKLGYVLIVVTVFHSEKNAAKDLLKRSPSHSGTVLDWSFDVFSLIEVYVLISAKSQAENVLISQWNSRLMFFGTMFFDVLLHCSRKNQLQKHISPVQLVPCPSYPILHVQVNDPMVFWHMALSWQLWTPVIHSLMSENQWEDNWPVIFK